jgi:hypothetical protein
MLKVILLVNAAFWVAESLIVKHHHSSGVGRMFATIQFVFNIVYVVESILKVLSLSWQEYWGHMTNKFDFVVSWVLFFTSFQAKPHAQDTAGVESNAILVYRWLSILRVFRLIRLVNKVPRWHTLAQCVIQMLGSSIDVLGLLFLPIYFFSGIGQDFWGGQLQVENNPELADTDYINDGHQVS